MLITQTLRRENPNRLSQQKTTWPCQKKEKPSLKSFILRYTIFSTYVVNILKCFRVSKHYVLNVTCWHVTCSTLCPMTKVGHLLVMVFGLLTMTTRILHHFLSQPLITHVKQPLICYALTTFTILPLVKTHTLIFFFLQRENWDSTSLPLTRTYISLWTPRFAKSIVCCVRGEGPHQLAPHPFKLVRGPS